MTEDAKSTVVDRCLFCCHAKWNISSVQFLQKFQQEIQVSENTELFQLFIWAFFKIASAEKGLTALIACV